MGGGVKITKIANVGIEAGVGINDNSYIWSNITYRILLNFETDVCLILQAEIGKISGVGVSHL